MLLQLSNRGFKGKDRGQQPDLLGRWQKNQGSDKRKSGHGRELQTNKQVGILKFKSEISSSESTAQRGGQKERKGRTHVYGQRGQ